MLAKADMSCHLGTLADTRFSQVGDMTGDKSPDVANTTQPVGVLAKKSTH
jgi:hypothetical protein